MPLGNPETSTGSANINSSATSPFSLRVIPRDQHNISRKDISPNALRVLYRLRESGFGAYLVGGAVRDLLVGGNPKDFDVATDATPEQVKALFRNCRLIGRRFRLAHVVFGREIIEVATFRANIDDGSGDREMENGMLVRDNVYGSIEDDAVRRDFTCNALYYAIEDFSVRDYTGGFEDVQAEVDNAPRTFKDSCHVTATFEDNRIEAWYAAGFGRIKFERYMGEELLMRDEIEAIHAD